jgi:dTDP-4-dehydrorhamnose reductase
MKAAIIGANGQLGSDLAAEFGSRGWTVAGLTHEDIVVEEFGTVSDVVNALRPDVVLNTAAFHVVPRCEEDPVRAYRVNALGALNVARVCSGLDVPCVYYSTDYVFDGAQRIPYTETDRPNPLNVYAVTKLAGEQYTLNYATKGVVLRVSGIYGRIPCRAKGGNFITTMIKASRVKPEVRVLTDEILSPTPTRAIAEKTVELLNHGATGLYHVASEGYCSWFEFARVVFDTLGLTTPLLQASVKDFPVTVRRPTYSALRNTRLASEGFRPMPGWRESLVDFLRSNHFDS